MEWHYNFIIRTLKQHVCNKKDRMLELENRGVGLTNFNEIIKTCKEHNVLPAFLSVITKNTNYMAYSRMLKSEKMKNLIGHKILYKNCKNLFEQLECNNIKYAVLKGPYLAENAYGETGLRSSSDIDILVDKRNLENMYEILNIVILIVFIAMKQK